MQQMLMGAHRASGPLASASKGNEREAFVNAFLADVLPPQFRFGTGDATDQLGNKSGQLDVVIEFPLVPSLPIVAGRSPRLYLVEGIVAVIEVKSDLSKQWDQVLDTAKQLSALTRNYGSGVSIGPRAGPKVPLYAIGYTGWSHFSTVKEHVNPRNGVNGVLVVEHGHFVGEYEFFDENKKPQRYGYERESSPMALWGLISCIHHAASMVTSTTKDVPRQYDRME
jgi:hypothetical protein